MKVLFLASEAFPFVKVGGLADVAGSLPGAINDLEDAHRSGTNLDIRVCIPFYKCINAAQFDLTYAGKIQLPTNQGSEKGEVFVTQFKGVVFYFLRNSTIGSDNVVYSQDTEKAGDKFTFSLSLCWNGSNSSIGFLISSMQMIGIQRFQSMLPKMKNVPENRF